ncbi:crotonobetainyl-CoA:carnitine CoA-transferase CaiB-like acyl-CoA transferase [Variovorax boronicumulans]|uniref:Crotonobetainyl-CoA:carnitine CoA-transferase CaiB-like acyl-CoA transferase n=1 Tax=Variovorax boronicumulans TaxID=436515 RepID=A0AAW8DU26_9BURK|nr:CoA transferase [Variovorax boronicumulans]MDP9877669.1 crotonobetainyl-CoA:carnitine CoA-transferase CaiB-like acyl-CoA transferase [Variovorax boronicumulans]MDP9922954.1 crotonobetainyl-CoA:carnitine CoA-transferase CaiB-like acyl-CoA transferase [Variovorax boronicumulans]
MGDLVFCILFLRWYILIMIVNDKSMAKLSRPLEGVRVIDMATVLMGPVATQILGDYGADVIKVEPPEGDVMRHAGEARNARMGPMYLATGRNKRSIVLDVKKPEGRQALLRLCETADLFIHNVRPAAMRRAGLAYEDIRAVNPAIVYLALVGFGQDGPYAERPAFDDIIQAASGLAGLFVRAGYEEPAFVPANLCDRMTGLAAAHAAIAALYMRQRTGEGQSVEIPMFETLAQTILGDHLNGEAFVPPIHGAGYSRLLNAYRRPFRTSDGFIAVTPYNDKQFRSFYAAIDREAQFDADERINTHAARARNYDVAYALLSEILRSRTTAAWLALCDEHEIPCQRVNTIEDVLHDPHLRSIGFFQEMEHPTEGRILQMRPAARWSGADISIRRLPPRVGENSVEVLSEAGFTEAEIAELLARGATTQPQPAEASAAPTAAAVQH